MNLTFLRPMPFAASAILLILTSFSAWQLQAQSVQPIGGDPATWGPPLPGQQQPIGGDPSTWGPPLPNQQQPIGGDPSTWGPPLPDQQQPIGGDPSTWGPPLPGQQQWWGGSVIVPRQETTVYETQRVWVPAHLDAQGRWIAGQWKTVRVEKKIDHGQNHNHNHDQNQATDNGMGQAGRYRYSKPVWLKQWDREQQLPESQQSGVHRRTIMLADPNPSDYQLDRIATEIANRDSRNLQLQKVHFISWLLPAPNEYRMITRSALIEFKNVDQGRSVFMDVSIQPGQLGALSWKATSLYSELSDRIVPDNGGGQPRPKLNYRRPSWVVTKPVPGGIIVQDANRPEIQQAARAATALINTTGPSMQLASILHAGRQSLAEPKTYLVLQFSDGQIWEVVLATSGNRVNAEWSSLQ